MQTKTIFVALALAISTVAAPTPQSSGLLGSALSGNGNNNANGNLNNNTIASGNSIGEGALSNNDVSVISCSSQRPSQGGLINLAKRLYILLEVNIKGNSASISATALPNGTTTSSGSSSSGQSGLINIGPLC